MGFWDSARTSRSTNRRHRGAALVLVIGIMFLLLALGTGTLYCGLQNRLLAIRDGEVIVAKAAADAGLRKAVLAMHGYESGDLPSATGEAVPGSPASYSYAVTQDRDGTYSAVATGTSGTAVRTVACKLKAASLWSSVLLDAGVSLESRSQIRSSVAGSPLRLRTNTIASGKSSSPSILQSREMLSSGRTAIPAQ